MAAKPRMYNSVWQWRADSWYRLDEAAEMLARLSAAGRPSEGQRRACEELLADLGPLEHYWAYPGGAQFEKLNRLFALGDFGKFAPSHSSTTR